MAEHAEPTPEPPVRVERDRRVEASPERVWEVLADPAARREVLGGELDVALVPGAAGRWAPPEGDGTATVREVEPARRLVLDWAVDGDGATVDLRLVPLPGGATHVRVVETRHAPPRAATRDVLCLAA